MISRLAIVLVVAASALVGLVGPARAQEADVAYRVKPGDTVELIAAEFYGDHARTAVFVIEANKLKPPYKLVPGERLKIPVTRQIATAKGDSFGSLAAKYLGDAKRAPFIAELNHMRPGDVLPTGTVVALPFHVAHVAQTSEPLAAVATAFYGDPRQADAIRAYNALDKAALDKGESILVPVTNVRTRPEHTPTLDADSEQRHATQRLARSDAQAALPLAHAAWLEGDFDQARHDLEPVAKKLEYLDTPTAIEVGVLAAKADVAFDDNAGAIALFQQVRNRAPDETLSAFAVSPKVLEAWQAAGGAVK